MLYPPVPGLGQLSLWRGDITDMLIIIGVITLYHCISSQLGLSVVCFVMLKISVFFVLIVLPSLQLLTSELQPICFYSKHKQYRLGLCMALGFFRTTFADKPCSCHQVHGQFSATHYVYCVGNFYFNLQLWAALIRKSQLPTFTSFLYFLSCQCHNFLRQERMFLFMFLFAAPSLLSFLVEPGSSFKSDLKCLLFSAASFPPSWSHLHRFIPFIVSGAMVQHLYHSYDTSCSFSQKLFAP